MNIHQLKEKAFYAPEPETTSRLHSAVMDEICETVLKDPAEESIQVYKARIGFMAALKTTKAFLLSFFAIGDTITVNYRDTTTTFYCPTDLEKLISTDVETLFDEKFAGTYSVILPDPVSISVSMN